MLRYFADRPDFELVIRPHPLMFTNFVRLGAMTEEMTFERGLRNGPYRRFNKGVMFLEAIFEKNRCVKNCDF